MLMFVVYTYLLFFIRECYIFNKRELLFII